MVLAPGQVSVTWIPVKQTGATVPRTERKLHNPEARWRR